MISVTKIFKADASHILPEHNGKCANFHGHTYTYEITVRRRLDTDGYVVQCAGPQKGMVVDFGDLADYWKKYLEPFLDHVHLNDSLGPDFYPTAELLSLWVAENLAGFCKMYGVLLVCVNVHEGPGSFATYTPPPGFPS